jgi:hypothetical protein
MNANFLVTGFKIDAQGLWGGWSYDALHDTLEEFLPSIRTIAQGVTASGDIVGNVRYEPGGARRTYGFLRQPGDSDEDVELFLVNSPFYTAARGIASGGSKIVGFLYDADGVAKGFAMDRKDLADADSESVIINGNLRQVKQVTLDPDRILSLPTPCNPDELPPPPDPLGWDLYTEYFLQGVNNYGVIVGECDDLYFNETTGGLIQYFNAILVRDADDDM